MEKESILANRYKIIEKLGEGGMGSIYRVFDQVEKKEVALKQLKYGQQEVTDSKPGLLSLSTFDKWSESEDLRFKQEFHAMAKLKHPNTVEVYEYGKLESGVDYITMEIVQGRELDDLIKSSTIQITKIYRLLIQIAQVLNFIHSRHMVHRDIKPANITVLPDGTVKLMDFGLMNQMGIPSQGTITGTVFYLPPEVATGGVIDARSDLYSLGILGYEAITGKVPFNGTKTIVEVIRAHISEPPPPPSKFRRDVPKELESIILKLLKKKQSDRYQTSPELLNDLSRHSGEKVVVETFKQVKSYLTSSEIIGREKEAEALKKLFAQIQQGKGKSVYVTAPAGVGKSRLIQEFKLKVQLAEVPFFIGQCFEQGMFSYQPIADAFENLIPWSSKEQLDKYGPVLVKIIPDLKNRGYEPLPNLEAVSEKNRLFETVTNWLKEIAQKKVPFVLCLEDLHWGDISSIEMFNVCQRGLNDSKILIMGTFRDDEVAPSNPLYLTVDERVTEVVKLDTLKKNHMADLITGMLGQITLNDEFINDIYEVTGGNPFFISETMRVLVEDEQIKIIKGVWELPPNLKDLKMPTSIEGTIERRLTKVNPEVLELLKMASIVGRNIDIRILKHLSGLSDEKLFTILDEILERQFMYRDGDRYTFSHDRVRESLYKKIDEQEKKRLHLLVGEELEQRHQDHLEPVAAELAYHFSRGDEERKAGEYFYLAGVESAKINASVEATKFMKQAIKYIEKIPDFENRDMVLVNARETVGLLGLYVDPEYVIECLQKYLEELKKFGNIMPFIRILKTIFGIVNMLPKALSIKIKKALNKPPKPKPKLKGDYPTLLGKIILNRVFLAAAYPWVGDYETSLKVCQETHKYIPDTNGVLYSVVAMGASSALIDSGQNDVLVEDLKKALAIFNENIESLDELLLFFRCYCSLVIQQAVTWIGRNGDEKEYIDKVMPTIEEHNFVHLLWYSNYIRSQRLCFRGEAKEALRIGEIALVHSKKLGKPAIHEVYPLQRLSRLHIERGELEHARSLINSGYSRCEEIGYPLLMMTFEVLMGKLEYEAGNQKEAINHFNKSLEINGDRHFCELPHAYYSLGLIELDNGNLSKAEEWMNKADTLIHEKFHSDNSIYHIELNRYLGRLHLEKKNYEKAEEYFKKSISICEEEVNPFQASITKIYLGKLYGELKQPTLKQTLISEAINHFKSLENIYQARKAEQILSS